MAKKIDTKKAADQKTTVEESKPTYNPDLGAATPQAAEKLEEEAAPKPAPDSDAVAVQAQETVAPEGTPVATYSEPTELAEPANTDAPIEEEGSWDLETWLEIARQRLGVNKYVLIGALHGLDTEAHYTEREMRRLVEKFLNKPAR